MAHLGALAAFGLTRREALWQVAAVPRGALFERSSIMERRAGAVMEAAPPAGPSPLPDMSPLDRTLADYTNSGLTVGPQAMKHLRADLTGEGVLCARDLRHARDGSWAMIAGLVIVRQRPGTAKGFCFITLEDETGTANAVVTPDMFQRHRAVIHTAAILRIDGPLQRVDDVIHVRARRIQALDLPEHIVRQSGSGYRMRTTADAAAAVPPSHDFR